MPVSLRLADAGPSRSGAVVDALADSVVNSVVDPGAHPFASPTDGLLVEAVPGAGGIGAWRAGLADIQGAHRHRWPDRPPGLGSSLRLLAGAPVLRLRLLHRVLRALRTRRALGGLRGGLAGLGLALLAGPKWLAQVQAQSELSPDIDLPVGVRFSERGQIFFGAPVTGPGTVVCARVTVGSSHVDGGRPHIGRGAWIGPDCVLYGNLQVGDGATLLPGTVLTKSLPPGALVGGNPARLLRRHFDNRALRALDEREAVASLAAFEAGGAASEPQPRHREGR